MLQRFVDILMNLKNHPAAEGERRLIAHRGAWNHQVVENSRAAFQRAQKLGAWGIELDVHFTKDAVPVVHHDPTLKRILKLPFHIADYTWKQLQEHTKGHSVGLISLESVLELRPIHFMIEIKTKLSALEISSLRGVLRNLTPCENYHLLALHPNLIFTNSDTPSSAWVLVGEYNLPQYTRICIERNLGGVAGHYLLLHNGLVRQLHSAGKKAGVGFIPNRNLLNRELARGIDWIFTNTLSDLTPR